MAKKRASKKKSTIKGNTAAPVDEEMIVDLMFGEMAALIVNPLREMKVGWGQLTEDIQQTMINNAQQRAEEKIRAMVSLCASIEYPKLSAELVTTQIKPKEIIAKISLDRADPNREEFFDFVSKKCVVVLVDPDDFLDEQYLPKAEPDQRSLIED